MSAIDPGYGATGGMRKSSDATTTPVFASASFMTLSFSRSAGSGNLRDDLLGEEPHRANDLVMGEATAREGAHEVADPERLVVHADLVRDLLGVAGDRRLIERLFFRERQQVLAHAPIEAVLVGRRAGRIRDQTGLRAVEPHDGLPQILARLFRRLGDVDDLVDADLGALVGAVRGTPLGVVGVVVLAEDIERREGR